MVQVIFPFPASEWTRPRFPCAAVVIPGSTRGGQEFGGQPGALRDVGCRDDQLSLGTKMVWRWLSGPDKGPSAVGVGGFSPEPLSQHRDSLDSFCISYLCWAAPWCHPGHPFARCGCIWSLGAILQRAEGDTEWSFCGVFPRPLTSVWGSWTPHVPMAGCTTATENSCLRCAFPSSPEGPPAPASAVPPPWQPGQSAPVSLHPWYSRAFFFVLIPFFSLLCTHHVRVCVKVVFSKTSLFIDDVIVIVLFFWLINCLLSLLCMPAKISHTSSWKGYEETSNWKS